MQNDLQSVVDISLAEIRYALCIELNSCHINSIRRPILFEKVDLNSISHMYVRRKSSMKPTS